MNLVLWIDEKELNLKLFDKIFKKKGYDFYGLESVEDFSYLIRDLTPSVIVIDSKTALKNLDRFQAQFAETNRFENIPLVVIDYVEDLQFLGAKIYQLETPMDPFEIPEKIASFLSLN